MKATKIRIFEEEIIESLGGEDNINDLYKQGVEDCIEVFRKIGIVIDYELNSSKHIDPEKADLYLRLIVKIDEEIIQYIRDALLLKMV